MIQHSIKSLEETYMNGSGSLPPIRGCGLLPRVLPPYSMRTNTTVYDRSPLLTYTPHEAWLESPAFASSVCLMITDYFHKGI